MMDKLKTPDLTPAQIVAQLPVIVGALVAFGFVDDDTAQALVAGLGGVITSVWILADAIIRNGRSHAVAAAVAQPAGPVVVNTQPAIEPAETAAETVAQPEDPLEVAGEDDPITDELPADEIPPAAG